MAEEKAPSQEFVESFDYSDVEGSPEQKAQADPVADSTDTVPDTTPAKHDPTIADMARKFRISDEQIQGMAPEALTTLVSHLQRNTLELLSAQQQHAQQQQQQRQDSEPPDEADAELEANKDELDDRLVKILKTQNKRIKELQSQLTGEKRSREADRAAQVNQQFDDAFNSLGEEYASVFGQGTINSLSDPVQSKRRVLVARQAAEEAAARGLTQIDKPLLQKIAKEVFPVEAANPELKKRIAQYGSAVSARPSTRKPTPANGREQFATELRQYKREKGFMSDQDIEALKQSIPE